jgi:hypothetical protein
VTVVITSLALKGEREEETELRDRNNLSVRVCIAATAAKTAVRGDDDYYHHYDSI